MPTMRSTFENLAKRILQICEGRTIDYIANKGNWGDSLIREGTLRFFADFQIPFRELGHGETYTATRDTVSIYGGSGAWCRFWNHGEPLVRRLAQYYRHVIVLPTTYEYPCAIPNVTFVARDRFEGLKAIPQAIFCHDMAFFLDHQTSNSGEGIGLFLRMDKESTRGSVELPPQNCDLSLYGHQHSDVRPFFDRISQYQTIVTDRLHVAIAGHLLGRTVYLLENGYFKNRSVYLSSMSQCSKTSFFSWLHPPDILRPMLPNFDSVTL